MMSGHKVVSREAWLAARKEHLAQEKAFTRQRDELSQARRDLPWVKVEEDYVFDSLDGPQSLGALFGDKSQLIVQHFMYGPDWEEGCPSCSFWADGFDGFVVHLAHRDVTMIAVSRAPVPVLEAYKKRMGWHFDWVSSLGNNFNQDYGVTFSEEEIAAGQVNYNYKMRSFPVGEAPGISVFYKDETGDIFHTYSCYSRGLDMMNAAYHYLDLVPKGRDEDDDPYGMAWLKRHDQYES